MKALARFQEALAVLPPPGCGEDLNLRLLGAANHGVLAGLDPDEIFRHIHIDPRSGGYVHVC